MPTILPKYTIVFLIRGYAAKYHKKLMRTVGPKFNENLVLDKKELSHVTLKNPFYLEDISVVETLISNFVKKQNQTKIVFGGFDHFRTDVLFSKIKFGIEGHQIQKKLINELSQITSLEFRDIDFTWDPHATISLCSSESSFKKMWAYVQSLEQKYFELEFDNITILKKTRKYWKIHKSYPM